MVGMLRSTLMRMRGAQKPSPMWTARTGIGRSLAWGLWDVSTTCACRVMRNADRQK